MNNFFQDTYLCLYLVELYSKDCEILTLISQLSYSFAKTFILDTNKEQFRINLREKYIVKTQSRTDQFIYKLNNLIHNERDNPTVIYIENNVTIGRFWYKFGILHRNADLPAIDWGWSFKEWYVNGIRIKLQKNGVICTSILHKNSCHFLTISIS